MLISLAFSILALPLTLRALPADSTKEDLRVTVNENNVVEKVVAGPTDVWCPHPPCPAPDPSCQHLIPTYFYYRGQLCQGCDYCNDLEDEKAVQTKRMISENFPYCPVVHCKTWAPPCPVEVQYQQIPVADYICSGCPFCPVDTTTATTYTTEEPSTTVEDEKSRP